VRGLSLSPDFHLQPSIPIVPAQQQFFNRLGTVYLFSMSLVRIIHSHEMYTERCPVRTDGH
jgi:hypothetical protein